MKERHGKGWLPEETQILLDAFAAGRSVAEIAHQLGRSERAVQIRAERHGLIASISSQPNEGLSRSQTNVPVQAPQSIDALTRLILGIDGLASSLATLREVASEGHLPSSAVTAVARAYDRYDATLLQLLAQPQSGDSEDSSSDPLPDRLREALTAVIRACVRERKRRFITFQLLGLDDDGIPPSMATLARTIGRSRERIRQLRNSAFRQIASKLAIRIGSSARLRTVLNAISPDTDWSKPSGTAPWIIKLATDNFAAAELLTFICCRAAGADAPAKILRQECANAASQAANDPNLHGSWRFNRWEEAQAKAIFATQARFESPPADLIGLKRTPGRVNGTTAFDINSKLLGRPVLCESGTERRVYQWLERSPTVQWYQEQPTHLPYQFAGRERQYYPDVAVMSTDGQVVVIEVKPAYQMYRYKTLAKASAALRHFGARGIGFLLIDASGRTLTDIARHPFSLEVAERIEELLANGALPFGQVRHELTRLQGRFDFATFSSMVVNRDWGVTDAPGVRVLKLPDELSFRPLLSASDLP
ncbi:TnsA endonuclease N-terminal domain-containing protein [Steroidobacter cummioxidans]|uniref:TnsA endonuclease N-terminal domain-containing protein n=1 Tax=Steroidobacter cummioxidans TaxID=1803913 RepID=UPI000E31EBB0|nr:TnsA endonuclease N-terminal domain-containing protein [Steroidobacter cummioxidans]